MFLKSPIIRNDFSSSSSELIIGGAQISKSCNLRDSNDLAELVPNEPVKILSDKVQKKKKSKKKSLHDKKIRERDNNGVMEGSLNQLNDILNKISDQNSESSCNSRNSSHSPVKN
jgi:hypothetical protein